MPEMVTGAYVIGRTAGSVSGSVVSATSLLFCANEALAWDSLSAVKSTSTFFLDRHRPGCHCSTSRRAGAEPFIVKSGSWILQTPAAGAKLIGRTSRLAQAQVES